MEKKKVKQKVDLKLVKVLTDHGYESIQNFRLMTPSLVDLYFEKGFLRDQVLDLLHEVKNCREEILSVSPFLILICKITFFYNYY